MGYVEVEEVTTAAGSKSVRRFSRMEKVDLSLFKESDETEHATDKMVKAQQVLLTSEEPVITIESASEGESEDSSPTLYRADRSWLKSTLSM